MAFTCSCSGSPPAGKRSVVTGLRRLEKRQHGADPGQTSRGEGLDDVVVRTQLQAHDAVDFFSLAVSMMMGSRSVLRTVRHTSVPVMPGIIRSRIIRSGCSERTIRRACSPSYAETWPKPSASRYAQGLVHHGIVVRDQDQGTCRHNHHLASIISHPPVPGKTLPYLS